MDTSFLKLFALVTMMADHLGVVIFPGVTELRIIGRMALPLYAWCLVVGSVKTHDPLRYGLRLLALALISQPINMMALNNTWSKPSVLFLLTLGLAAIYGIRAKFCLSQLWAPVLCYVLLGIFKVDYGWKGLTFILVLYFARQSKGGLVAAYLAYALFWGASSAQISGMFGYAFDFSAWTGLGEPLSAFFRMQGMVWLSLPFIAIQTHTGLRVPKWLGYGLYPLHLVLIILIRLCMGVSLQTLTACFH